jgi:transposase
MPKCSQLSASGDPCRAWAVGETGRCAMHADDRERPRLTPEIADQLVSLLRAGSYVEVACETAGVPRRTFYDWWRRGDPGGDDPAFAGLRRFRRRVEQAKSEAESRQVAIIAQAARESWQAAAWLLERRYPERWARASQREKDAGEAASPAAADDPFAEVDELAQRRRHRVE